jgi:hypothetical protein
LQKKFTPNRWQIVSNNEKSKQGIMKKKLILTVFALVSFGCGGSSEVKNTTTVNAPPANPQANAQTNAQTVNEPVKEESFTAGANPRADLISAAQKLQKVPSWSAKITSETNPEVDAEIDFIAPDRYHFKKTDGELIVIGNDSYEYQNGKWKKLEGNIGEYLKSQITSGIQAGVKNLQNVQIVGKEKFNGKDTIVYTHNANGSVIKIWIANDSGLQLKNEEEANLEGQILKQTRVYDYDKKVKIEAPKID